MLVLPFAERCATLPTRRCAGKAVADGGNLNVEADSKVSANPAATTLGSRFESAGCAEAGCQIPVSGAGTQGTGLRTHPTSGAGKCPARGRVTPPGAAVATRRRSTVVAVH